MGVTGDGGAADASGQQGTAEQAPRSADDRLAAKGDGGTCTPITCAEALDAGEADGCSPVSLGCKESEVCPGLTCGTPDVCAVTAPPLPLTSVCMDLASADFNGDGAMDLATQTLAGDLAVYLGRGDGTFGPAVVTKLGITSDLLVVGDVNGDGKPDLVGQHDQAASVAVLIGQGDGTFVESTVATTSYARALALADLDGDGSLDLVLGATLYTLDVFAGHGDGTFGAPQALPLAAYSTSVQAVDVDGDGHLDLVACGPRLDAVTIFHGTGGGAFGPREDLPAVLSPITCAAIDVNGDGTLDLVSTGPYATSVLLGSSGGFLGDLHRSVLVDGSSAFSVAGTDMNGDGRADIVIAARYSQGATVLQGRDDGDFEAPVVFGTYGTPWAVVAGDWNGDGHPDLATCGESGKEISILLNGGCGPGKRGLRGGGAAACALLVPGSLEQPLSAGWLASGDLNGDGLPDVVGATSKGLMAFLGDGKGALAAGSVSPVAGAYNLVLDDLDDDGILDAAVVDASAVLIMLGKGDGTFGAPATFPVAGTSTASWLHPGDFNGDGRPDLAYFAGSTVQVMLNAGGGTFLAPTQTTAPSAVQAFAVGDFDGDGKLDVAVALDTPKAAGALRIFPGHGDGTFGAARVSPLATRCTWLVARDYDGDGRLDVAGACNGGSLYVTLGLGNGKFSAPYRSTTAVGLSSLTPVDLDGDGKVDLMGASRSSLVALRGAGDGTFAAETVQLGVDPGPFTLVDLNGDGKTDFVFDSGYGELVPMVSSGCFGP